MLPIVDVVTEDVVLGDVVLADVFIILVFSGIISGVDDVVFDITVEMVVSNKMEDYKTK